MLMVTGISEDSVTAFYIFFLIKNYQRIRKSEPADAIFYFFVPQLLTKSLYKKLGYKEIGIVPTVFNGIPDVMLVMLEKRV